MSNKVQGFVVYRIYYGDEIVYVGRTKQPLQNRIRGHVFGKAMHRKIDIEHVSKIEYAMLTSEADMNLYEIYYILKLHPPLNVDDNATDSLSVSLPELSWLPFETPLWEKWKNQILNKRNDYEKLLIRYYSIPKEISDIRAAHICGVLSQEEFDEKWTELHYLREELRIALHK